MSPSSVPTRKIVSSFGLNATQRPPSEKYQMLLTGKKGIFGLPMPKQKLISLLMFQKLPLSMTLEDSVEKFFKVFEKLMFSVSLYHKAVLTIVQLVTLPSPDTE